MLEAGVLVAYAGPHDRTAGQEANSVRKGIGGIRARIQGKEGAKEGEKRKWRACPLSQGPYGFLTLNILEHPWTRFFLSFLLSARFSRKPPPCPHLSVSSPFPSLSSEAFRRVADARKPLFRPLHAQGYAINHQRRPIFLSRLFCPARIFVRFRLRQKYPAEECQRSTITMLTFFYEICGRISLLAIFKSFRIFTCLSTRVLAWLAID